MRSIAPILSSICFLATAREVEGGTVSTSDALVTIDDSLSGSPFPESVAVGDFDADGAADLAMAHSSPTSATPGDAWILGGPATGSLVLGDDMTRVSDADSHAYFGWKVASGDLDGDGTNDLVVSALGHEVFVFSGPIRRDRSTASADAVVSNRSGVASWLGEELDVVSDCDGDGAAELMVGDPQAGRSGAVFIEPGGLSGTIGLDADAIYRFDGVASSTNRIGGEVEDMGDATGDGIADVAIAEWGLGNHVYVVEGGMAPGAYDIDAVALATITGPPRAHLGSFAMTGGDYDGDGLGDLIAGAPAVRTPTGVNSGKVYAFLAPFSGEMEPTDAATRWVGRNSEYLGQSGMAMGDVDGDGGADVLMASSGNIAYVQLGFASGLVSVETLSSITPEGDYDQLGTVLAAIPDWTGDGGDEIVIGAASSATDAGDIGSMYVIASEDLY